MFKILINNIELPIVKQTLRIKKESSVFSDKFTISRSTKPFIVIDNEISRQALGIANLYSLSTKIIQNAKVLDNEEQFDAEVTVVENIRGGIKCNLKYSSDALKEFPKKIHSYFQDISVSGTPQEYQESTETTIYDSHYRGFVENYISQRFPEVDFNFPTLRYPRRQGEQNPDDDWQRYEGEINNKVNGRVTLNSNIEGNLINKNIVVPYYYLLAPLYKVFSNTLGYNISGDFIQNKAIRQTLMYHENDNLTEVKQGDNTLYSQWLTINPDRFLPDWTVAEYLNNLKNHFNIKIDIINATKEIKLNFVDSVFFNSGVLDISSYAIENEYFPKYNSTTNYIIKSSDEDDLINININSISGREKDNENTIELKTAFKAVPEIITENWEKKSGIGLLFYDFLVNPVYNVEVLENQSNRIDGFLTTGIARRYWLNWFRMRLKSKEFPLQLKCSPKQKHDLELANKIYLLNQEFLIKDLEFEQIDKHFLVKLNLLSFNL